QQEERNGEQRFGVHAVENLLHDGGKRDVGQQRADEDTRHQRERHGHAEIAEEQEAERHQAENDRCAHRPVLGWIAGSTGAIEMSSSGGSGWSKPLRMPLTSCSIVNSAISTPDKGIAA